MVDVDKPIFIKLLEHGEEVGLSGTDFDHVQGWAWENQLISNTQNSENEVSLLRDLFFECFTRNSGNSAEIWVLKNEYYFRLLEYKELSEARNSSRLANRNAIFAIIISVIAMLTSIVIGFQQLTGQVNINKKQILSINENIENQSLKIDQTLKEGFSNIVNTLELQPLDANKSPVVLNKINDATNPNKTNAAEAKSRAAD
ncbi:MAG: hypothetical protein PF482_08670 [Desulfobacteraceae bacterium]|nr:hypothetical protein [Desulfobacteraceae bacterium]